MTQQPSVTVQVPASTSNCGPGFDTLAIGLCLYNFIKVRPIDAGGVQSTPDMPVETVSMAAQAAEVFADRAKLEATPAFEFEIWGEIPPARGLGSSGTVRAGVVAALNHLHSSPLDMHAMIGLVAGLDGAPDNATACFRGGFVVSRLDPHSGAYVGSLQFPVAEELTFVVVAPEVEVRTRDARLVLPESLPFNDAVRSINSSSYLTAVFASRKYERLAHAVADYVHQPYRQRLCAFVAEAIDAGVAAGAYTGWLSGSGSSVLCVSPAKTSVAVAKAMGHVFSQNGIAHRLLPLKADNQGLRVV